jgi:hypothetical protein
MVDRLAHIRRGTASTLERMTYTRPQSIGNFVLKHEEIGQTWSGTKHDSDAYIYSYMKVNIYNHS